MNSHSHHFLTTLVFLTAGFLCAPANGQQQEPQVRWVTSLPHVGWLDFKLAKAGQLVTIVALEDTTGDSIPIARSYDGRPFEVAPGPYADGVLPMRCPAEVQSCGIDITVVKRIGSLQEITYSSYLDPNSPKGINAKTARFLEQAT